MVCLRARIRSRIKEILKKKERDDEYNKNGIRFKIETQNVYSRDEKFYDLRTLLDSLAWGELHDDFQYFKFNDDYYEDGMKSEALELSNLIEEFNYWEIDSETLLVESSTESNETLEKPADENESYEESNMSVVLSNSWQYHSTIA